MNKQKMKPCDYPKQEIKVNWKGLSLHLNALIHGGLGGAIAGLALYSFLTWSGSASCKVIERASASGEMVYICRQGYRDLFPFKLFIGATATLGYLIVYNQFRLSK